MVNLNIQTSQKQLGIVSNVFKFCLEINFYEWLLKGQTILPSDRWKKLITKKRKQD